MTPTSEAVYGESDAAVASLATGVADKVVSFGLAGEPLGAVQPAPVAPKVSLERSEVAIVACCLGILLRIH